MGGKAWILVGERVRHAGERFVEMGFQHLLIGHVARDLAQAVHIVGKADQAGLALTFCQNLESVANHARARNFGKGSDMR